MHCSFSWSSCCDLSVIARQESRPWWPFDGRYTLSSGEVFDSAQPARMEPAAKRARTTQPHGRFDGHVYICLSYILSPSLSASCRCLLLFIYLLSMPFFHVCWAVYGCFWGLGSLTQSFCMSGARLSFCCLCLFLLPIYTSLSSSLGLCKHELPRLSSLMLLLSLYNGHMLAARVFAFVCR